MTGRHTAPLPIQKHILAAADDPGDVGALLTDTRTGPIMRVMAGLAAGGLIAVTPVPVIHARAEVAPERIVEEYEAPATVPASEPVRFTHSKVTSTPAPPPPPPVVVVPPPPVDPPAPARVAQHTAPIPVTPAPAPAAGPPQHAAPAPPVPAPSGLGGVIAQAALSQLGRIQDCTALATNSLAAAGIHFHGWPAGYLQLGPQVSAAQAQPGDLLYYQNGGMGVPHIAVYLGGGMAVHGGWLGNQTVEATAYVGSGPVFIRV